MSALERTGRTRANAFWLALSALSWFVLSSMCVDETSFCVSHLHTVSVTNAIIRDCVCLSVCVYVGGIIDFQLVFQCTHTKHARGVY